MRTTSGTKYRQGDLILLPFPFTDLSSVKRRPALIVSPARYHLLTDDIILVALTSQVPPSLSEFDMLVTPRDMAIGYLPKPSVIKVGKIFTAHRDLLVKRVGRLRKDSLSKILERLQGLFA